jgi:hypothetical protein
MDIIEKLKKDKKIRSVFDVILDNRESKEGVEQKPNDLEVRELSPASAEAVEPEHVHEDTEEPKPVREFRTEGMHEFDIESLGSSTDGAIRIEYKSRVCKLIDTGRFDEAVELLKELRSKLGNK